MKSESHRWFSSATMQAVCGVAAALVAVAALVMTIEHEAGQAALLGGVAVVLMGIWLMMMIWTESAARARGPARGFWVDFRAALWLGLCWVGAGGVIMLVVVVGLIFVTGGYPQLVVLTALIGITSFVLLAPGVIRKIRRRRANVVLGYVEQAMRLNLPLAPMMEAAARSEKGFLRATLSDLHHRLAEAGSVEKALESTVPAISRKDIRAIGAAERVNRLPHTLARMTESATAENEFQAQHVGIYRIYPLFILLVASGFIIFVIPKYRSILREFHMPVPWATMVVIQIGNFVSDTAYLWLALLILFALRYLIIWSGVLSDGRFLSGMTERVGDWAAVLNPLTRGSRRDRALADLCDFIGDAVLAGEPLDKVLWAQGAAGRGGMGRKVRRWAAAMESGQPVHEAARQARMPGVVVAALALARDGEDIARSMAFLSRHYEFRKMRAEAMARAMYVPAMVFLLGSFVAFLAIAMFQPMVLMVNTLTSRQMSGF